MDLWPGREPPTPGMERGLDGSGGKAKPRIAQDGRMMEAVPGRVAELVTDGSAPAVNKTSASAKGTGIFCQGHPCSPHPRCSLLPVWTQLPRAQRTDRGSQ